MIVGMLIFPEMTQLDFSGPHEVFAQIPECQIKVISRSSHPVTANHGLTFVPDTTIDEAPWLDLIFVPGGPGIGALMQDLKTLEFLRQQAGQAKYVTSVCTGALVLGAAGLLKGYRATTHWLSLDLLPIFGATAVPDRIVMDGNRITGGGVTAGIDFALTVAAEVFGDQTAKTVQLLIEYSPAPPFDCGHPSTADAAVVEELRGKRATLQAARLKQAKEASKLFCT
jgi:cyclohexyl-isocyanide hydratase